MFTQDHPQYHRLHLACECIEEVSPSGRWLDVGCGPEALLPSVFSGIPTVELDVSLDVLRAVHALKPHVPAVQASLEALPFARHSFDLIALLAVLGALSPGGEIIFFKRLADLLRPGGWLVILVSARGWLWEVVGHRFLYPRHWRHFTEEELIEAIQRSGLVPETIWRVGGIRSLLADVIASRWPNRILWSPRLGWCTLPPLVRSLNRLQAGEFRGERLRRPKGRYLYIRAHKPIRR